MSEVKFRPGWWNEFIHSIRNGASDRVAAGTLELRLYQVEHFANKDPTLKKEWAEAKANSRKSVKW